MGDVPIGSRGWLGNPYSVEEWGLDDCLEMFREDFEERLREDREFRAAVRELAGSTLGCWCRTVEADSPPCHGDVIADWADDLARETEGLDE